MDTTKCIFCGKTARIIYELLPLAGYQVRCYKCGARGPFAPSRERATIAWDFGVGDPDVIEMLYDIENFEETRQCQ